MEFLLYSAVQTEIITKSEAKMAIKLDSSNFDDNISITSCISGGYHSVTATATGSGISLSGQNVLAMLQPISLSAGATLDVKLQESLDNVIYTDVDSGTFTQVTTANDTAIQEKEYTGNYPYIRAVYTIAGAQANFLVNMIKSEPYSVEDDYIDDLIKSAREYAEEFLNRAIGSQKWKLVMDDFPGEDYIKLPMPPLISVSSVTYMDVDGVSATMSASESDGYIVFTDNEPGKISLAYGSSWPSFTPYPYNGVEIIYTCGYSFANIPRKVKDAMLKYIGAAYHARQNGISSEDLNAINNLLRGIRVWPI
jgi:uncharacterized phiE125 gp8 family phage protein